PPREYPELKQVLIDNFEYVLSSTLAIKRHGTKRRPETRAELGEVLRSGLCAGIRENPDAPSSVDAQRLRHRQRWVAAWCTKPLSGQGVCLGERADRRARLPKRTAPANTVSSGRWPVPPIAVAFPYPDVFAFP